MPTTHPHRSPEATRQAAEMQRAVAQAVAIRAAAQRMQPEAKNAALPRHRCFATAAELIDAYSLSIGPEARQLLQPEFAPAAYFERLLAAGHLAEARVVLAHALPKRRALWWALLATWDAARPAPPPELQEVLERVLPYVLAPSETRRRAIEPLCRRNKPNTIAGVLATAAFFSAGGVLAEHLPYRPPQPQVTARLASVAVYLAAVRRDPANYRQVLAGYLLLGRAVAHDFIPWQRPQPFDPAGEDTREIAPECEPDTGDSAPG